MPALVVDFETNGLSPASSILQAAILVVENGKVVKIINRYYLPKERFNWDAYWVHGFDEEKLLSFREKATYPECFDDDEELLDFLKNSLERRKDLLVVYNADFEVQFLQKRGIYPERVFDVMRAYTPICQIPHPFYGTKFPRLEEAVRCLGFRPKGLHNALIDAHYTYRLFKFYPYLEQLRPETFERFLQLEMTNEYPVELYAFQRFDLFLKRKQKERKLLREFLKLLEETDAILIELGQGQRKYKKDKLFELFLLYLHADLVQKDSNSFLLGAKYRIIFRNIAIKS